MTLRKNSATLKSYTLLFPNLESSQNMSCDYLITLISKNNLQHMLLHYENLPMQYTEIFLALKIEIFQLKDFDIFLIFAQNIDCGYTLEPPRRVPTIYVFEQK